MTEDLWLSRIRLKPDADVRRIAARLLAGSAESDAAIPAQHHLLWDIFGDGGSRRRDFLWREDRDGAFLALSRRPPPTETALFTIESKPFAPQLAPGDRLGFSLRANAAESGPGSKAENRRGKRRDVVKRLIDETDPGQRASDRMRLANTAGLAWFAHQGDVSGFRLLEDEAGAADEGAPALSARVTSYRVLRIPRGPARAPYARQATFGVFDFEGMLEVTDPGRFLARLAQGFGRARAFGFGLMLIRRYT